jgi:hypothetical protein
VSSVAGTGIIAFGTKARRRAATRVERRYPARIARQLALAHALQKRVEDGEFVDYSDMSRALGFTRARITQIMDLLLLASDIQEEILFLEVPPGAQPVSERAVRDSVLRSLDWQEQRRRWGQIKRTAGPTKERGGS